MTCDRKIRPFPGIAPVEITCDGTSGHRGSHAGVLRDYAFPGSATVINWQESDRRNFTGDWIECPTQPCVLPANHRGEHAA